LDRIFLTPVWLQIFSTLTFIAIVGGILWVGYMTTPGLGTPIKPRLYGTLIDTAVPDLTPSTTLIVLRAMVTPTFFGPTPLVDLLSSTYTPTPFYVNTPHPKLEAYRAAINSLNRQDGDKMLSYIQQAITSEPNSADLYYYLGEAYRLNKDYSNAINAYKQALNLNPLFAPAYLGRGRATLAGFPASWKDAKGDMIRSTDIDPNLYDAYLDIANVTMDHNLDAKSALKYLDLAYKQNPNSPLLHLDYAKAYLMLDQPEKSLEEARLANQLDITLLEAYRAIGEAAIAMDQPEQAVQQLTFYSIYRPDDSEALSWLGMAYRQQGDNDKALDTFNKAIKLDNNQFTAYLQRGLIYMDQNQPRLAQTDLEQAIEIDKTSFDATQNLGRVLLSLDQAGDAYVKFSIAEGLAQNNVQLAQVYYWRAISLQALEKDKPNYKDVEAKDWTSLLRLPLDVVTPEWATLARQRLIAIKGYAPPQATAVKTATATKTSIPLGPTKTIAGVGTPFPTSTPTP
jgi:tetratricopeptide (TPR) repeat protein